MPRPPNVPRAICDTTVSVSLGMMPYACASSVMPMNMVIAVTAMVTSVDAAFRLSGGRNAVRDRFDAGHRGAAVRERGEEGKGRQDRHAACSEWDRSSGRSDRFDGS